MAVINTGIVERPIIGVNDGGDLFLDNSTSTATNTGIVERDIVGKHDANFVHPIGNEEILNGSFSQEGIQQADDSVISDSNNAVMTKVSALNYNATSDGTGASTVRPRLLFNNTTIGKSYRIRINPTNQSGTINFKLYDGSQYIITGNDLTTNVDLYFKAEGTSVFIAFDGTEVFNVDFEISLKEVGQDWSFTSGATLTDIGAKITHTPTAGSIAQLSVLTIGKQYKLTYEITESISGGLKFNSAVNSAMVTTVGVHTKYFEADGTTAVFGRTSSINNDVTITNISVKEMLVNRESTTTNTGIVERPITGVNESDPMFPDNTISNIVNIAGIISSLLADLEARATTFENEEATREILINLQKC